MQYLGTAGFVFSTPQRTLVLDPFISRPSVMQTLCRPLQANSSLIEHIIPKADEILIGHSHHDHMLDAPQLALQTGARVIGSEDTANITRAYGVPEAQIVCTRGHEDITCGEHVTVRGLPSVHGKVYFGRIPLAGRVHQDFVWPSYVWDFKHGQVFNWLLDIDGFRIVHVDSADFLEEEWRNIQADVVCLCAIGRQMRKNYVADVVRLLRPKIIIACHWDLFTVPIHSPVHRLLPGVDIEGFVQEISSTGTDVGVLPILGTCQL